MSRKEKSYKDLTSEEELEETEKKGAFIFIAHRQLLTSLSLFKLVSSGLQLPAFIVLLCKSYFSSSQTTEYACLLKTLFFGDKC